MEGRGLKESSQEKEEKDEKYDGSSPEVREQRTDEQERENEADTVTTGLEDMSLSGTDKEEEQENSVISSLDFNPSSDGRYKSGSQSEPVSKGPERSVESGSILPPHYSPESNLMSSRTMTDQGSQKREGNEDSDFDTKDQGSSFQFRSSPSKGHPDKLDSRKEKKIPVEEDLDSDGQPIEVLDHSMYRNSNYSDQEGKLDQKQRGQLEVAEEESQLEKEIGDQISETEHNFLDQGADDYNKRSINVQHFEASDLPVKAAVHYIDDYDDDEEHSECDFPPPPPESQSLRSEPLRPSNKGPAPQPPTTDLYERSQSAAEVVGEPGPGRFGGPCGYNQHVCPTALLKYQHQPQTIHFLQLGYNTNLRKPPENWLRMKRRYHAGPKTDGSSHGTRSTAKHGSHHYSSHFWSSYSLDHSSWSMFSSFRYSIPSSWRARKNFFSHIHSRATGGMANFDTSLCMCCVCCNCAKINQTNCCCCYHCVHTVSSCRRSDLIRQAQRDAQTKGNFVSLPPAPSITPVSILKKKGPKMLTDRVSDGSQVNLIRTNMSEDDDEYQTPPPSSAPIFAFCPKRAPTPSPEPGSYALNSSEDNSARPDFEMSPDHSPIKCSGSELLTVNNNSINSIVDEDAALIPLERGRIRIM